MPTIRRARNHGFRIAAGAAALLAAPGVASAEWGTSNWGTLVWGAGGGVPAVPALGPGGSVLLAAGILVTGSWLVKTLARRRASREQAIGE